MELLIFAAQTKENLLCILLTRLLHHDGLETARECGVLCKMLLVLAERRCTDDLHLAARKSGLQNICRIKRALGSACADERVNLVNEEDDVLRLNDIVHDILEPLLELAAVLCPRYERRHRQRDDALVLEEEGHLAVCDALGKPLCNRGLSDPRLPEENGVILRTPCENLDHAVDLRRTPDDGIEPARPRNTDQIAPEFLE